MTAKQFIEEMYPAETIISDTYRAYIGNVKVELVPDTEEWYIYKWDGFKDVMILDMSDLRTAKAFIKLGVDNE